MILQFGLMGVELDSNVSGNTLSANTLTTLKFQASNGVSDFHGNVKKVKLYKTALITSSKSRSIKEYNKIRTTLKKLYEDSIITNSYNQ